MALTRTNGAVVPELSHILHIKSPGKVHWNFSTDNSTIENLPITAFYAPDARR